MIFDSFDGLEGDAFNHRYDPGIAEESEKNSGGLRFMDMLYEAGVYDLSYSYSNDKWKSEADDAKVIRNKIRSWPVDKPFVANSQVTKKRFAFSGQDYIVAGPLFFSLYIGDYDLTEKILDEKEDLFIYGYGFTCLNLGNEKYEISGINPLRVGALFIADPDIPTELLIKLRERLSGTEYIVPRYFEAAGNYLVSISDDEKMFKRLLKLYSICPDMIKDAFDKTVHNNNEYVKYLYGDGDSGLEKRYEILSVLMKVYRTDDEALEVILSQLAINARTNILEKFNSPSTLEGEITKKKTGLLIKDLKWLFERVKSSRELTIIYAKVLLYLLSEIIMCKKNGVFGMDTDEYCDRVAGLEKALVKLFLNTGKVDGKDVLLSIKPENMVIYEKNPISSDEELRRANKGVLSVSLFCSLKKRKRIFSRNSRFVREFINAYLDSQSRSGSGFGTVFPSSSLIMSPDDCLHKLQDAADGFTGSKSESELSKKKRLKLLSLIKDDDLFIQVMDKGLVDVDELPQLSELVIKEGNYEILPAILAYM